VKTTSNTPSELAETSLLELGFDDAVHKVFRRCMWFNLPLNERYNKHHVSIKENIQPTLQDAADICLASTLKKSPQSKETEMFVLGLGTKKLSLLKEGLKRLGIDDKEFFAGNVMLLSEREYIAEHIPTGDNVILTPTQDIAPPPFPEGLDDESLSWVLKMEATATAEKNKKSPSIS